MVVMATAAIAAADGGRRSHMSLRVAAGSPRALHALALMSGARAAGPQPSTRQLLHKDAGATFPNLGPI